MNGVQLLLIIGAGITISAFAKRRGLEPGMIIVVLAAAASFIPGVPRLELDSEMILAIVIPPLLYSATRGASFSAFGANLRAIVTLGVLLVLLTTGVHGGLELLRNAFVGLLIGVAFAVPTLWIRKRLGNPTLETTLVLLVPFTAFLVAEQADASGILAVVAAAFSISANLTLDPKHQYAGAYRTRLQEEAFWPVLDFLLETFVFAYIGLQLHFVLDDLYHSAEPILARTLVASGVLLLVAIVFRLLAVYLLFGRWTLKARLIKRRAAVDLPFSERVRRTRERRNRRGGEPLDPPTQKETLLVGWIGMRGILTLAAAGSIPESVKGRDSILAIALFVTLGTLVIQGTTIGWLTRRLKFDLTAERATEKEMRERGRQVVADAAAEPSAGVDASFDAQRLAVGTALHEHGLTEEVARELIEDLDLRQAAQHTVPRSGP